MPLMHLGRNNLAALATGSGTAYDSTGAILQVSSATSTTFTATSTDVGGTPIATTMESGYPSLSTNQMTFRGVASTEQANFAWECWGVTNATATGTGDLLNRVQESLGTKTSAQSWQFTADITLTT
jgi:hypothetical protein